MEDLTAALQLQRGHPRAYTLEARGDTARMLGDYQVRLISTSALSTLSNPVVKGRPLSPARTRRLFQGLPRLQRTMPALLWTAHHTRAVAAANKSKHVIPTVSSWVRGLWQKLCRCTLTTSCAVHCAESIG